MIHFLSLQETIYKNLEQMLTGPTNPHQVVFQTEPKGFSVVISRIGHFAVKKAFLSADFKALLQLRLVCKAWKTALDANVEKPWKKLGMLDTIKGNNCFKELILHPLGVNRKTWDTLSSIQKVFFMSIAMQTQLPNEVKLPLSQIYHTHWNELTYTIRVIRESKVIDQVTEDFLQHPFVKQFEISQFYKDRLELAEQPFLRLYLLRKSLKSLEYPISNFFNSIFIGKNSSKERSETFFLALLEHLKKYFNIAFKPANKAHFDSLNKDLTKVLATCVTAKELKRALSLYPLNPKTLTLLSLIAYLECKKDLAQDIAESINQPENHNMALRSYFAALLLFTQSDKSRIQVKYLLDQIRLFPIATINAIQIPMPLVNILASRHVPIVDLEQFLEAGLQPNPTGKAPSPLCNPLALDRHPVLLRYHANPNHCPPNGKTAFQLHLESESDPLILVQLLKHGANFSLIPSESIYQSILALLKRTLDQATQRADLVTLLQALFEQVPKIIESYPGLIFLRLLVDSSYAWESTHPGEVNIFQFDPLIKEHKKHLNYTNAEKFGRVLFCLRIRETDLISYTYDHSQIFNSEIRCAVLKGFFKTLAVKHPESRVKLDKEELEQILSDYYDQGLLNLLLNRIFSKTSELPTHILTLAKNRQTALSLTALQSIAAKGFDFNSIPILSKIAPEACTELVLRYLMNRGLDPEKKRGKRTLDQIWSRKAARGDEAEKKHFEAASKILRKVKKDLLEDEKENNESGAKRRKSELNDN